MPPRITITDVAREAGVSAMTVSRAVNNRDGISETTRQRILDVAEKLGYRPSGIARSLVTSRTKSVGLVVSDNSNPFFSEVARGVENVAYAEGYSIFLCNTNEDSNRERAVLRILEERRVDGLILCGSRLEDDELLDALSVYPTGILVNRVLPGNDFGTLRVADDSGARQATELLLQNGHKKIGFLAGPVFSYYSSPMRARGYRLALKNANIPLRSEWEKHCAPTVQGGKNATIALLTQHPQITALFCYNDLVAVGALQACQEIGRRVPDDLAVVGSDDIYVASLVMPPLTTCRININNLGEQAMYTLLKQINNTAINAKEIVFEPELVIRASAP